MGHPWSGSVSYRAFGVTSVSYQNTSILMRIVMYPECTLNDTVGVTLDAYQDTSGYLTHSRYMRDTYEIHVSARVINDTCGIPIQNTSRCITTYGNRATGLNFLHHAIVPTRRVCTPCARVKRRRELGARLHAE
jgi:hypothetical protein